MILRREGEWWVVGERERGLFHELHRFGNEGDACKWMLHDLVSHEAMSMGIGNVPPHVSEEFRSALLVALDEVAALVRRHPEV